MIKVTVYLKSGQTVEFKCESCSFSYDDDMEFSGYEINGVVGHKRVSFVPSQIAAYTVKER